MNAIETEGLLFFGEVKKNLLPERNKNDTDSPPLLCKAILKKNNFTIAMGKTQNIHVLVLSQNQLKTSPVTAHPACLM